MPDFFTHIVPTGGKLFENFINNCLSYSNHRKWTSHKQAHPNAPLGGELFEAIVEAESSNFMSMVWLALGNMGTAAIVQQHYLSFLLKFKGCSRSARAIGAQMGWCSKSSSFDTWLEEQSKQAVRRGAGMCV